MMGKVQVKGRDGEQALPRPTPPSAFLGRVTSSHWNARVGKGTVIHGAHQLLALKGAIATLLLFLQRLEEGWSWFSPYGPPGLRRSSWKEQAEAALPPSLATAPVRAAWTFSSLELTLSLAE